MQFVNPTLYLALLLFFGCGGGVPGGIPTRDANVVVFIVDTLRADAMGLYGGDPQTSPNLERFAARGATFEDCRASSPWTLPSMGSIFTGRYPRSHGSGLVGLARNLHGKDAGYGPPGAVPKEGQDARRLPRGIPTLAQTFRAAGYQAWMRATNAYLGWGSQVGFDVYKRGHVDAADVVDWGLKRLESRDDRPLLLVLHFIDVHTTKKLGVERMAEDLAVFEEPGGNPLTAELRNWATLEDDPESFRPMLDDRWRMYQASLRYVDRQIGRFLDEWEARDPGPTYFVFTSDHGEEFRDHWEVDNESAHFDPRRQWEHVLGIGHGHNLHHAVTHVPLVVVGPGVQPGLRVRQRVGLTDIFPTLCALTGLEVPSEVQGRPLTTLLRGREEIGRPYLSESIAYGREKKAFYTQDGWLLLIPWSKDENGQLFNLDEDPLEHHNLWDERPEKAAELRASYKRFARGLKEREGEVQQIDAEQRKALEELGYIDGDG